MDCICDVITKLYKIFIALKPGVHWETDKETLNIQSRKIYLEIMLHNFCFPANFENM